MPLTDPFFPAAAAMVVALLQGGEAAGGEEGEAAGAASENNLIINYLPSHVTEIELRVSNHQEPLFWCAILVYMCACMRTPQCPWSMYTYLCVWWCLRVLPRLFVRAWLGSTTKKCHTNLSTRHGFFVSCVVPHLPADLFSLRARACVISVCCVVRAFLFFCCIVPVSTTIVCTHPPAAARVCSYHAILGTLSSWSAGVGSIQPHPV